MLKEYPDTTAMDKTLLKKIDLFCTNMGKEPEDAVIVYEQLMGWDSHVDKHIGLSNEDLLERVFAENNDRNSTFATKEEAIEYVTDSIFDRINDIMLWVDDDESGFKENFAIAFGKNIGTGAVKDFQTNLIKKYECEAARIVLKKDANATYGFTVLTAYPDTLSDKNIELAKDDFVPFVKNTKTYKTATPVEKTYLMGRCNHTNEHALSFKGGHDHIDDVLRIHVKTNEPNIQHNIKLKEDKTILQTISRGKTDTKIDSKYTQIAANNGKLSGKNINLNNAVIKKAFKEDYPEETVFMQKLQYNIKDQLRKEYGVQKHKDRIRKAQSIVDDLDTSHLEVDATMECP